MVDWEHCRLAAIEHCEDDHPKLPKVSTRSSPDEWELSESGSLLTQPREKCTNVPNRETVRLPQNP